MEVLGKMSGRVQIGGDDRMEPAVSHARLLGELIEREGWAVLSGGRDAGVMLGPGLCVEKRCQGKRGASPTILRGLAGTKPAMVSQEPWGCS